MRDDNTCEGCVYHEREQRYGGTTTDYCWVAATGRVVRKSSEYIGDYPRKCIHKEAIDD